MNAYADTNFVTRLYLALPHSREAMAQMERLRVEGWQALPVTWLHRVEIINAFQLLVFTGSASSHQPRVTSEQAAAASATFRADLGEAAFFHPVQPSSGELEAQFEELSLRHTARHGFRTYDMLHVASALVLGCDTFWSFDSKASKLATMEGLKPGDWMNGKH